MDTETRGYTFQQLPHALTTGWDYLRLDGSERNRCVCYNKTCDATLIIRPTLTNAPKELPRYRVAVKVCVITVESLWKTLWIAVENSEATLDSVLSFPQP